jgi:nicotinate-nucleotide pyrophosphorylase
MRRLQAGRFLDVFVFELECAILGVLIGILATTTFHFAPAARIPDCHDIRKMQPDLQLHSRGSVWHSGAHQTHFEPAEAFMLDLNLLMLSRSIEMRGSE